MVEAIWEVSTENSTYQAALLPLEDGTFSLEVEDPYDTTAIVLDRKHVKDLAQAIEMALEQHPSVRVPCWRLETRFCPESYGADGCGDKPCARFESDDEKPWLGGK